MKNRTWIGIGIFAVLLIIVLAPGATQLRVGIGRLGLPILNDVKVTGIQITGVKSVTLRKKGASWEVANTVKPNQWHSADEGLVHSLLDAYRKTQAHGFVSEAAEKHV